MKTIVIYCSKTGFTRRYADLLASALQCECAAFEERQDVDLNAYDCVIFGSWVCAGAIQQVKWFKKQIQALKGKRLIAFAVGATPVGAEDAVRKIFEQNFSAEERSSVDVFYLQGGLSYERMGGAHKWLLRLLCRMLSGKKQRTPEEEGMLHRLSKSFDAVDPKAIEPILQAARRP